MRLQALLTCLNETGVSSLPALPLCPNPRPLTPTLSPGTAGERELTDVATTGHDGRIRIVRGFEALSPQACLG